jgi:polyphosphate kinase 2 (PPK2 family)
MECGRQGRRHPPRDVWGSTRKVARSILQSTLREDLDHDFLWRTNRCLPERGRIGIFNRSSLRRSSRRSAFIRSFSPASGSPLALVTKDIWRQRFTAINATEGIPRAGGRRHPASSFSHVSKEEQKQRSSNALPIRIEIGSFPTLTFMSGNIGDELHGSL